MSKKEIPSKHYNKMSKMFPEVMAAVEKLGKTVREAGPIDNKTAELIQLAVAASNQSTGSVHSHTRRAIQAGATEQEVYHSLLLLISTIGFPKVAAAMSWDRELLDKKK